MADAALTRSVPTRSLTEDWLAVWIGLPIFALALLGVAGPDLLGWAVTTSVWTDPAKALGTASKTYAGLGGVGALATTYVALLAVLFRYINLRRIGCDRDGKRDKIQASHPCHRVFAGRDLRGHRSFGSAVSSPGLPLARTPCRGRLDWAFSENGRCRRGGRRYHGGPLSSQSRPPKACTTKPAGFLERPQRLRSSSMFSSVSGAFILAYIWTNHINVREGDTAKAVEIWQRFPKFIIGFVVTFLVSLALALTASPEIIAKLTPAVQRPTSFASSSLH